MFWKLTHSTRRVDTNNDRKKLLKSSDILRGWHYRLIDEVDESFGWQVIPCLARDGLRTLQ